jgi:hypothetical protein
MLLLIPPPRATEGTASQTAGNLIGGGQIDGRARPASVRPYRKVAYLDLAAMMASDTLRGASE